MSKHEALPALQKLLLRQRWAALASVDAAGAPLASMVGYTLNEDFTCAILHLSRLAAHTRNLLANPQTSLVISEQDDGRSDPQQLVRATLHGKVEVIARESPRYGGYQERYLQHLPDAAPLFDFPDFILFELRIEEIRYVGGFAQTFSYRRGEWLPPHTV